MTKANLSRLSDFNYSSSMTDPVSREIAISNLSYWKMLALSVVKDKISNMHGKSHIDPIICIIICIRPTVYWKRWTWRLGTWWMMDGTRACLFCFFFLFSLAPYAYLLTVLHVLPCQQMASSELCSLGRWRSWWNLADGFAIGVEEKLDVKSEWGVHLATGPLCTSHDMNRRRNPHSLHASSPSDIHMAPPSLARLSRSQSRYANLRIRRNFLSQRKAKQKIHQSSASHLPRIYSMRLLQLPTTIPHTTSPTSPATLIIHGFGNTIPSIWFTPRDSLGRWNRIRLHKLGRNHCMWKWGLVFSS